MRRREGKVRNSRAHLPSASLVDYKRGNKTWKRLGKVQPRLYSYCLKRSLSSLLVSNRDVYLPLRVPHFFMQKKSYARETTADLTVLQYLIYILTYIF